MRVILTLCTLMSVCYQIPKMLKSSLAQNVDFAISEFVHLNETYRNSFLTLKVSFRKISVKSTHMCDSYEQKCCKFR